MDYWKESIISLEIYNSVQEQIIGKGNYNFIVKL
jgi:hypothetical protein